MCVGSEPFMEGVIQKEVHQTHHGVGVTLLFGSLETGGLLSSPQGEIHKLPPRSQTTKCPSEDPFSDSQFGKFPSHVSYAKHFCLTTLIQCCFSHSCSRLDTATKWHTQALLSIFKDDPSSPLPHPNPSPCPVRLFILQPEATFLPLC